MKEYVNEGFLLHWTGIQYEFKSHKDLPLMEVLFMNVMITLKTGVCDEQQKDDGEQGRI